MLEGGEKLVRRQSSRILAGHQIKEVAVLWGHNIGMYFLGRCPKHSQVT